MSHRIPDRYQRVGGIRAAIMRHAFWTVAALALICALAMLFDYQYTQFAVCMALVLVASCLDLWVHRRGRYRDRSATLLLAAVVAIAVTALFSQLGVTA